jgi:hypothetical protein
MYKHLDEPEFLIHNDSVDEQRLRQLSAYRRTNDKCFIELLYAAVSEDKGVGSTRIPHSDVFYCRAALEAKFPDRTFTIEETVKLLEEVYGYQGG